MKKPYHIVNREEKGAAAAVEEFVKSNGQLLLPLIELITQARIAVDEVIGSAGRKTIETILILSAEEVAGARTPGKASGDIVWHEGWSVCQNSKPRPAAFARTIHGRPPAPLAPRPH